jgi:hypothetical protein
MIPLLAEKYNVTSCIKGPASIACLKGPDGLSVRAFHVIIQN